MTYRQAVIIGKIMCEAGYGDYCMGAYYECDPCTPETYPRGIYNYFDNTIETTYDINKCNSQFKGIAKQIEKALKENSIKPDYMRTEWAERARKN